MSAREYNGVRGLALTPWDEPDTWERDADADEAAAAREAQRRIDDGESDEVLS